ncbi:pyridoxal 5'-phosphate synthase glutaminase subunit PdxT [bacterium]|nr:pyridoxal 5'-phosphate synthase glutaminase subunit PdxT [bacterium]
MAKALGILGLQGDYALHARALHRLGIPHRLVKWPEDLKDTSGLILPGGESTTFLNLMEKTGLRDAILRFAQEKPLMGTCAGLIVLATRIQNQKMKTLGLIDLEAKRNAFGRQIHSFQAPVRILPFQDHPSFDGVFIRAPQILSLGGETQALGFYQEQVVMARNRNVLVMTFHPELTADTRIHRFFYQSFVQTV